MNLTSTSSSAPVELQLLPTGPNPEGQNISWWSCWTPTAPTAAQHLPFDLRPGRVWRRFPEDLRLLRSYALAVYTDGQTQQLPKGDAEVSWSPPGVRLQYKT